MTATLMMEALRDIQVLPGPGKVLSVGPHASFHLHPDYDSLFVRECYPRLFDAIVREPTPTRYIGEWLITSLCLHWHIVQKKQLTIASVLQRLLRPTPC